VHTDYYLSPGWLKIDPTFTPLRGNPRFERLVEADNSSCLAGTAAIEAEFQNRSAEGASAL
jgi:hypothetical protein